MQDIQSWTEKVKARVAGMDDTICTLCAYVQRAFSSAEPFTSILLHGPSGTGKSLLGQSLAQLSGLPYWIIQGSNVFRQSLGESEKWLQQTFSLAKLLAPSFVVIDELDVLLPTRTNQNLPWVERRLADVLISLVDLMQASGASPKSVVLLGRTLDLLFSQ
jgi:SpoVK/Ycf46/Vps4 family AAA+-type ATPase